MSMWRLRWHFTRQSPLQGHLTILKLQSVTQLKHYGEEYDDWNSAVFMSQRKCSSDDAERTDGGRAFHARAAATGTCTVINDKSQGSVATVYNDVLRHATCDTPSFIVRKCADYFNSTILYVAIKKKQKPWCLGPLNTFICSWLSLIRSYYAVTC